MKGKCLFPIGKLLFLESSRGLGIETPVTLPQPQNLASSLSRERAISGKYQVKPMTLVLNWFGVTNKLPISLLMGSLINNN